MPTSAFDVLASPVSDDYYLDWDRGTRQADGCAADITGDSPYAGLQIIYDWGTRG